MANIGTLTARVVLDHRNLDAGAAAALRTLRNLQRDAANIANIPIRLNTERLEHSRRRVRTTFGELVRMGSSLNNIQVNINTQAAERNVRRVRTEVEKTDAAVRRGRATREVKIKTDKAVSSLRGVQESVGGVLGALQGLRGRSIGVSLLSMVRGANQATLAFEGMASAAGAVGPAIAAAAAAFALFAGFRNAAVAGTEFQHQMERNRGVLGATSEEFAKVTDALRLWAANSVQGAKEGALGLYELASAGLDARESILALPKIAELSIAGFIDMKQAADVATSAMRGMGIAVEDLSRVNDALVQTSNATLATVEGLQESFKYVVPFARQYGYNIEEVAGFLGVMAEAGIRSGIAGRSLAQALRRANEVAIKFGYTNSDLVAVLDQMAVSGATAADIVKAFAQRGGLAALVIASNLQRVRQLQKEIATEGVGASAARAKELVATYQSQFKRLRAAFEEIRLQVFDKFGKELGKLLGQAADWIRTNRKLIVEFLGGIFLFATNVLRVVGFVAVAMSKFADATRKAFGGAEDSVESFESAAARLRSKFLGPNIVIPADAAGGGELFGSVLDIADQQESGEVRTWARSMRARAASTQDAAELIEIAGGEIANALATPNAAEWETFVNSIQNGIVQVTVATTALEAVVDSTNESLKSVVEPDRTTWGALWRDILVFMEQFTPLLDAIAKISRQVLAIVTATIAGAISVFSHLPGIIKSIGLAVRGDLGEAVNLMFETLDATGREGEESLARLQAALVNIETGFVGPTLGDDPTGLVNVADEIQKRYDELIAHLVKPTLAFGLGTNDAGAKAAKNIEKDQAKAFQAIIKSGQLTVGQFERIWKDYETLRLEQIRTEAKELELTAAQSVFFIASQVKELRDEWTKAMEDMRKSAEQIWDGVEIGNPDFVIDTKNVLSFQEQLDADVSAMADLLDVIGQTSQAGQAVWNQYLGARLHQIDLEAGAVAGLLERVGLSAQEVADVVADFHEKRMKELRDFMISVSDDIRSLMAQAAMDSSSVFSQFFFDVIKGEAKKTMDYIFDIVDKVAKRITDRLADILANKLVDLIIGGSLGGGGGGGGFGLDSILPNTATGGVFYGKQARMIGEAGPEAVIPLARLNSLMREIGGNGDRDGVKVDMRVYTDDVRSFRGSEQQIISRLSVAMRQAQLQRGD